MYLLLVGIFCVVALTAYFAVCVRSAARIESSEEYFISPKRLSSGSVFATLYAAEMSIATVFIAFFQLAPFLGYILLASVVTFAIGQGVLWAAIPKIRASTQGSGTLAGFVGSSFSSVFLRRTVAGISILGFVGLFVTEIVVGANLISAVSGGAGAYWPAVLVIFTFVLLYTLLGGFQNVVATDRLQVALIIGAVIALTIMAISIGSPAAGVPLIDPQLPAIGGIGLTFLGSLVVINILYPLVDMAAWQRVTAAKDTSSARNGFLIGIALFLVTWGATLFAGLALSENAGQDVAGGLAYNFQMWASQGTMQTVLAALGVSALMAALLSAGDVFLIVAAQAWVKDIVGARETGTTAVSMKRARRAVLLMAALGVLLVTLIMWIGFTVADLVFVVYGSTVALLPTVLASFFRKAPSKTFRLAAILSSLSGVVLGWIYGIAAIRSATDALSLQVFTAINFIPGDASPYNAPIMAVAVAAGVFVSVAAIIYLINLIKARFTSTSN